MKTKNTYIFIIWNKALWCKNKILNDLEQSFIIRNQFYIKWSKEYFGDNLKALYGRKLGLVEDKTFPCGKGKFLFLIVEDPSPNYENRPLYDGQGTVNSRIYDKKMLYRIWTAGSHRIHCSDDEKETKHDLAVLFGNDFPTNINNDTLHLNTKSIIGFYNFDDLIQCLLLFGNNICYTLNGTLYIFAKCRYDIECFLHLNSSINNKNTIFINNKPIQIYIFGELDGDLPIGFIDYSLTNTDIIDYISNNIDSYINFISNRSDTKIVELLTNTGIGTTFNKESLLRNKKDSLFKKLISESKLIIKRFISTID